MTKIVAQNPGESKLRLWYNCYMALFLREQGKRTELQNKLASELREKLARESEMADKPDLPDGVDDSAYMKSYEKKDGPNSRVITLLVILAVVIIIGGLVIVLAK